MNTSVVIVEDQKEIRESLQILINGSEGLTCLATYESAEEAMDHIPSLSPNIAIIDIHLPNASGIECIKYLKPLCENTQFLICSVFEDPENIFNALKAGANGYLLKNTPPSKMLEALNDISKGGSPMSSQIARKVIASFQTKNEQHTKFSDQLTARENEMLSLLSKGFRYKEIAEKLFISHETVKTHIRNIYEKLQVQSKIEALNKVGLI